MKNAFLFIKRVCVFIVLALLQFLFSGNSKHQKNVPKRFFENSYWSGTLTLDEIYTGITGTSERHVTVNFSNAVPTLHRDEIITNEDDEDSTNDIDPTAVDHFTDDKGTGSETFHGEMIIEGKKMGMSDCSGSGQAELHKVDINDEDYSIEANGPICTCTGTSLLDGTGTPTGPYTTGIIVSDRTGIRRDILAGTKTTTSDIGVGTVTRTITWHLTRLTGGDVELIVTPTDYDSWLPEPGKNERTAGTVMSVSLKLQGINGTVTKKKAKSFELRLINSSTEPGMTINFPVNSTNTSPDLRFMPQPKAFPGDTSFQTMTIVNLPSSQTGNFKIGSYDGGGWTTLIAEAILDDARQTRVQGKLLVSGGERDIRIPKREANSKIGEAWLKANKYPAETDDIETSKDNKNNGDGFTAYEEYRGVISKMEFGNRHPNNFGRLKPNKKELGIWATKTDFTLFDEGIGWFKAASDLEIVHFDFDRDEIAPDGKLNMNVKSAHDFDQYALFLLNGGLGGKLGKVYTKTNTGPGIPAQIISVVADWNEIMDAYYTRLNSTRPELLKFTVDEYLASTVAHELGHAVAVWHHGNDHRLDKYDATIKKYLPNIVSEFSNSIRIFDHHGHLITDRPQTLFYVGAPAGTVESGDLSCMLNYYPYYRYGYTRGADGAAIYHEEPLIPLGKIFCKTIVGTDFNATQFFFSNGTKGNCLGQIKLRN